MKDYKRLTEKDIDGMYRVFDDECKHLFENIQSAIDRLGELEDLIEQGRLIELQTKAKIRKEAVIEFAKRYKEQVKNYTEMFTDDGFKMVSLEAMLGAVDFVFRQMFGDDVVQQ